jgi:two-component system, sensor histidine kinase PdtaS
MQLFSPDISKNLGYYDRTRFNIIWRLLLLFIFIFSILCLTFINDSGTALGIYASVLSLSVLTTIYVFFTKNYIVPYYIFSFSASALLTFSFIYLDYTLHYPDFLWIISVVLFAFIGLGKRWALFFIIYHAFLITYFFQFTLNRNLSNAIPLPQDQLWGVMIEMLFALLVISYLFYIYVNFKEYSEKELIKMNLDLEKRNSIIESKNKENITLVKEVHHRVKNNLQIVVSLLRMQSNELKTQDSKIQFSEAIGRVMAISLIHQKLYDEKNLSRVDYKKYIEELVNEVKVLHQVEIQVELNFDTQLKAIGLKSIVPLGLILNELITNSVKHIPKTSQSSEIEISLHYFNNEEMLLNYKDNGHWVENENKEAESFGLELITVLTEQLEGTFTRIGTEYAFRLKNLDH